MSNIIKTKIVLINSIFVILFLFSGCPNQLEKAGGISEDPEVKSENPEALALLLTAEKRRNKIMGVNNETLSDDETYNDVDGDNFTNDIDPYPFDRNLPGFKINSIKFPIVGSGGAEFNFSSNPALSVGNDVGVSSITYGNKLPYRFKDYEYTETPFWYNQFNVTSDTRRVSCISLKIPYYVSDFGDSYVSYSQEPGIKREFIDNFIKIIGSFSNNNSYSDTDFLAQLGTSYSEIITLYDEDWIPSSNSTTKSIRKFVNSLFKKQSSYFYLNFNT